MFKLLRLALPVLAIAATSTPSWSATYWIDGQNGADTANCGTASGSRACRTYYYLNASGCDSNGGCMNNIQTDLSNGVGATINFACRNSGGACTGIQSYSGSGNGKPLCFGFDGQPSSALTVKCVDGAGNYSPLNCKISGSGVTFNSGMAVVVFGATATTCTDEGNSTSYVKFSGFRIEDIPAANSPSAIRTRSANPNHIKISDCRIDGGTTANSDLMLMLANTTYTTYVNNVFTNCSPNGTFGCVGFQQPSSNLAAVGNRFGPRRDFPGPYNGGAGSNLDCHTLQGANRSLLDGNECFKTADGLDNGMLDSNKTQNLIVRFNDLHDVYGNPNILGSRLAKISGDATSNSSAEKIIFYKNIFRHTNPAYWGGAIWVTELARDVDYWYNTLFGAQTVTNDASIQYFVNGAVSNVASFYNIVDGTTTSNTTAPCANSSNRVCPIWNVGSGCSGTGCRWVGNRIWFAERGPNAPCIRHYLSGLPDATFNCDLSRYGGGSDFNSAGANSGNLRADPKFVNRGGAALTDYALTSASTAYLDAGGGFCTTTSSGSGNTVNVTCRGLLTDPRFYFPQPSDYYDLSNDECKGKGTRVGDSVNPGCYDFQIAGACGVRQITSMTASSITFSGPSCSWANGAMVHIPWDGAAPDVGAMEGFATGVHPPVLLEVVPTSGQ